MTRCPIPGSTPNIFSTKLIEEHLKELQQSVIDDEENQFREVLPRLNVSPKRTVAKDLPKIEVKPPAPPGHVKRKAPKVSKKASGPSKIDIQYDFKYEPVRLEAPAADVPADLGNDYMTAELVDLTWQFCRLSVPAS
jgi:hypothetical protein